MAEEKKNQPPQPAPPPKPPNGPIYVDDPRWDPREKDKKPKG